VSDAVLREDVRQLRVWLGFSLGMSC